MNAASDESKPSARKAFNEFKKPALFRDPVQKQEVSKVARLPSSIAAPASESAGATPLDSNHKILEIEKIKSGMQAFDSPALALTPLNMSDEKKLKEIASEAEAAKAQQPDKIESEELPAEAERRTKTLFLPLFRKRQPNARQRFLQMQAQLNDQETIEALQEAHEQTLLLMSMQNVYKQARTIRVA